MKPHFEITLLESEELHSMPGAWAPAELRTLLAQLEFDGIDALADEELGSYAAMALQDLEAEEAAAVLLKHVLQDLMKPGQIRNLAEEMKDERQWEENADMRCHEPIFNAQVLLHEAFPEVYRAPDVRRLELRLTALSTTGQNALERPISEPLLVRMLADGMPETAILKRLFADALAKGPFREASQILWQYETTPLPAEGDEAAGCTVVLYSPRYWVGPLEDAETFRSAAFPDSA